MERRYCPDLHRATDVQLHTCCDASEDAYCTSVFLRAEALSFSKNIRWRWRWINDKSWQLAGVCRCSQSPSFKDRQPRITVKLLIRTLLAWFKDCSYLGQLNKVDLLIRGLPTDWTFLNYRPKTVELAAIKTNSSWQDNERKSWRRHDTHWDLVWRATISPFRPLIKWIVSTCRCSRHDTA